MSPVGGRIRRRALGWAAVLVAGAVWAAPAPVWQRHVLVEESAGTDRPPWPILVRLDAPAADPAGRSLRVYRVETNGTESVVPFQVMQVADPLASLPGPSNGTLELCFQADLVPGATHLYRVRAGREANPKPATPLDFDNGGFGIRVDSGSAQFQFDPLSGQFARYRPVMAGLQEDLFFKQIGRYRPCHWNPDVWVAGKPWGHTSDWNCERPELRPDMAIDRGPLAFRMYRSGPMWSAEEVRATVVYTAFAGLPFLLESSEMRFVSNATVKAIRHNELVFSRGFHTLAVWPGEDGMPKETALYNKPDPKTFLGRVATVSADAPWVALVNDDRGYGIGVVNFWRSETAPAGASPQSENACIYFLDYGDHGTGERYDWNFAYVCRPLYYDPIKSVAIQAGSRYAEQSAFLAFGLGRKPGDRYADFLRWTEWLRQPPRVRVESGTEAP